MNPAALISIHRAIQVGNERIRVIGRRSVLRKHVWNLLSPLHGIAWHRVYKTVPLPDVLLTSDAVSILSVVDIYSGPVYLLTMPNTKTIRVPHLGGINAAYQMPQPYDPSKPTLVLVNSFTTSSELYQ